MMKKTLYQNCSTETKQCKTCQMNFGACVAGCIDPSKIFDLCHFQTWLPTLLVLQEFGNTLFYSMYPSLTMKKSPWQS